MKVEYYNQEIIGELMSLLLVADPDENSIRGYLPGSSILVARESASFIGIAVMVREDTEFELKNISVREDYQGKGIAKNLIVEVKKLAKSMGAARLFVGTGNSSLSQLALYQKCGFRLHKIEPNYFNSYPQPIYENGIRCIDMVHLCAEL
jgi:ribosomal protein S18 acetylase RimI-like enzyme